MPNTRRTGRLTPVALALATVVALALSACSSAENGATTTTGHTPPAGSTATTGASTTTTTTTSSAAPTTTSAPPPTTSTSSATLTDCQLSQLRVLLEGRGGAAGTFELTFSLTNTSSTTCKLYGYPGAQLLNSSGAPLATNVVEGGSLTFEDVAPTDVTLPAGQTAYFNMGYNDVVTAGTSCSDATQIEITPPNDVPHVILPVMINACDGGKLTTSPVFGPGSSATSTTAPPTS